MNPLAQVASQRGGNGLVRTCVAHHALVEGHASEEVVVVVVRRAVGCGLCGRLEHCAAQDAGVVNQIAQRQVGRHVIRVLPKVSEGHDVPHVLGVGLRVDDVHLNPVDHGPRIRDWQRPHRLVVLVHEVLRQEVVSVGFVVVGADVELLGLGTPLHFNLTPLPLLLAEHCGVVQTSPLGFQLQTKQTLRARNQAAVERHVDVARLDVLQDVVLLTLETDVHLVLKVKQCLRVELRSKLNLVSNLSAKVQLNPLVEIDRPRAPLTFGDARVLGVVPRVPQGDFRGSLRLDFDFVAAENHLEQLAVDLQLRRKGTVSLIFFFLKLVPKFRQVALDVVVQVLVQGEQARRPELQGVADGLLDLVHPCEGVVHHTVIEVARPLQGHPSREFSRIEHVPIVVGERQIERGVGLRLGMQCGHDGAGHPGQTKAPKSPPLRPIGLW